MRGVSAAPHCLRHHRTGAGERNRWLWRAVDLRHRDAGAAILIDGLAGNGIGDAGLLFALRSRPHPCLAFLAAHGEFLSKLILRDPATKTSGAVYVFDGTGTSYTNLSESQEGVLTVHDAKVHVLARDYRYDLKKRRPMPPAARKNDVT